MPGYFWPQALTWNSVSIEEDRAFYVDPDFKTVVFFPVMLYAVTKPDDLSFIYWNLSQHKTNNCKKADIIVLLQSYQQVIHSLGLVHLFCLFLLLRAEIRIFPKMRPSCCDADYG